MADHNLLGKKGEELARQYLVEKAYKIKHCNWRHKKNEIDIIAEKDKLLVVVEVKTRTNDYFENPKEAVTKKKQKLIIQTTEAYMNEFNIDSEVRFDIVAVTFVNKEAKIEHIIDAFQASLLL